MVSFFPRLIVVAELHNPKPTQRSIEFGKVQNRETLIMSTVMKVVTYDVYRNGYGGPKPKLVIPEVRTSRHGLVGRLVGCAEKLNSFTIKKISLAQLHSSLSHTHTHIDALILSHITVSIAYTLPYKHALYRTLICSLTLSHSLIRTYTHSLTLSYALSLCFTNTLTQSLQNQ